MWTFALHAFTAGAGWAYDYGTALQDVEDTAKGYSPVH
jgi:prolyl oligopeptidase